MPPRIQCLRVPSPSPSPFSSSVRRFTSSPPNRHPRKPSNLFPSTPGSTGQKNPGSKFNPFQKKAAFKVPTIPDDNPYQWSSIKPPLSYGQSPLPNSAWEINKEQKLMDQLRINPMGINPKQTPDEKVEKALTQWNRQHGAPPTKKVDATRDALLQDRFAFPLAHGQLYTSYDLTWRAYRQKRIVKNAINFDMPDPFERIGVDPYWEFKNWALLSKFVSSMGRIIPARRTGCSAKTQRKLNKAIRRARALGFMPIWSRHPQLQKTFSLEIAQTTPGYRMFRAEAGEDFISRIAQPSQ